MSVLLTIALISGWLLSIILSVIVFVMFQRKNSSYDETEMALQPLKERLQEFQMKVDHVYHQESQERFALRKELERMVNMNSQLSEQANRLTQALKSDVKLQGNWGEMVLERILESSGLREGHEYVIQGKELKMQDESGKRQLPDVIIFLPKERHIVIDSKVSLNSFVEMLNTELTDVLVYEKLLKQSIRKHIEGLSTKRYQQNDKLFSPEFVLMFIPIEGVFSFLVEKDFEVFNFAWERSVMLVSPTTLMVSIKTVDSLWKQEKQALYVQEMAQEAGRLYDKFASYIGELDHLGKQIEKINESYQQTLRQLSQGKGNLVSRFERLKGLGASTSKSIPQSLIS